MYSYMWHKLPGTVPMKVGIVIIVAVAVLALLLEVVYPAIGPQIFGSVTTGSQIVGE